MQNKTVKITASVMSGKFVLEWPKVDSWSNLTKGYVTSSNVQERTKISGELNLGK